MRTLKEQLSDFRFDKNMHEFSSTIYVTQHTFWQLADSWIPSTLRVPFSPIAIPTNVLTNTGPTLEMKHKPGLYRLVCNQQSGLFGLGNDPTQTEPEQYVEIPGYPDFYFLGYPVTTLQRATYLRLKGVQVFDADKVTTANTRIADKEQKLSRQVALAIEILAIHLNCECSYNPETLIITVTRADGEKAEIQIDWNEFMKSDNPYYVPALLISELFFIEGHFFTFNNQKFNNQKIMELLRFLPFDHIGLASFYVEKLVRAND